LTFEVELNSQHKKFRNLKHLSFLIEIPSGEDPKIENIENSTYEIKKREFRWIIEELNSENDTASCEIKFSEAFHSDDVFPILVELKLDTTFLDL